MPRKKIVRESKAPPLAFQKQEIIRCGKDPIYFINNYVYIQHPKKGKLPFKTFDYQDNVVEQFEGDKNVITNKSRQLGLSTVCAAYALWLILFQRNKNVLVIATKLSIAQNFMNKVFYAYDELPSWLVMSKDNRRTKTELGLGNGSNVKAIPTSPDAGRSEALSLLIVDECAHIADMDDIWVGLQPTLSTGGKAILISSPNGVGNTFHRIWVDAVEGKNDFVPIELPWTVHPERDQEWYDRESANIRAGKGERGVQQEFHCVSGTTKIVTPDGYKEIQDIKPGDLVLTHNGRFKKVYKTHKRTLKAEENVYEISAPGNRRQKLTITGNHPILSYKVKVSKHAKPKDLILQTNSVFEGLDELHEWKHSYPNSTRRQFYASLFPQCSIDSLITEENKSISLVDFCTLPKEDILADNKHIRTKKQNINKSSNISVKQELSYDFGRFVGMFAAEGFSSDKKFGFGFHINEKDSLVKFVEDFFDKFGATKHTNIRNYSKCITVTSTNKVLKNFLEQFVNQNSGATTKTYNMVNLLKTNHDFIKGVLVGHFQGDGDHPTLGLDNKLKVSCYSTQMLYQLKILLSCFGLFGRFGNQYEKITYYEFCGLENLEKENRNIEFLLSQKNPSLVLTKPNSSFVLLQDEKQFVGKFQYKKLETNKKPLEVFNLGVEEDESYVADSVVVHNCSFNASGDTFVKTEYLNIIEAGVREPIAKHPIYDDCWIWKYPVSGHKYLIAADVSRGNAGDFSTFHVFDTTTDEVVCEYKGKVYPDVLAEILIDVGTKYGMALLCPELNTYGAHTASVLKSKNYPNLYYEKEHKNIYMAYMDQETKSSDELPGWTSGPKSRDEVIAKLESVLRNQVIRLPSKRLVNELKTFVWRNNKAQAMKGYNDDLVMALAIGVNLYENSGRVQYSQEEIAKGLISGMSVASNKLGVGISDWGVKQQVQTGPFFHGGKGLTSRSNPYLPVQKPSPFQGGQNVQDHTQPFWQQWDWVKD